MALRRFARPATSIFRGLPGDFTSANLPSLVGSPRMDLPSLFAGIENDLEDVWSQVTGRGAHFQMDIIEKDNELELHVDAPGMKDSCNVSVSKDNILTISGERTRENVEKDEENEYYRQERSYGKFRRTLQLPDMVNVDEIHARHEDGVLKIILPKREGEEREQRTIQVE